MELSFKSVFDFVLNSWCSEAPDGYDPESPEFERYVWDVLKAHWRKIYEAYETDDNNKFTLLRREIEYEPDLEKLDVNLGIVWDCRDQRIVHRLFLKHQFTEAIEYQSKLDTSIREVIFQWAQDRGYVYPNRDEYDLDRLIREFGGE